jgi:hypothetical protein
MREQEGPVAYAMLGRVGLRKSFILKSAPHLIAHHRRSVIIEIGAIANDTLGGHERLP